jgi:hypothetical protein
VISGVPIDLGSILRREDEDIFLITKPVANGVAMLDSQPLIPWTMTAIGPKVLFKADREMVVAMGGHQVSRQNTNVTIGTPADLVIAHAPFTTRERFIRKVTNIKRAVSLVPHLFTGSRGLHWRRWIRILDDGSIDTEFDRQGLPPEQFRSYVESGVVQSLSEYFKHKRLAVEQW